MSHLRADAIAQDGYDLAPPRPHPGGGTIYQMVLAVPAVQDYPELGMSELVTPEALQGDWLDAVKGAPIIDADELHWRGTDSKNIERASIGTGLGARWDAKQQCVIAECVVDRERGIRKISGGLTGVSSRYRPTVMRADGVHNGKPYQSVQTARHADPGFHILVTAKGRGGVTRIRADALGGIMSLKQILLALFDDKGDLRADALGEDATPVERLAVTMAQAIAKLTGERDALKVRADALQVRADAAPTIAPFQDALALATKMGVEVKREMTLDEIQAAICAKIGVRADSADSRTAVIAAMLLVPATHVVPEPENSPTHTTPSVRRSVPGPDQTGGL